MGAEVWRTRVFKKMVFLVPGVDETLRLNGVQTPRDAQDISPQRLREVGFDAAKTDDGTKVVAKMKDMPTDDPLFGKGTIRADGRKIHPAYLVEVKKPSESKGPYDYYKVRATIPADQAFRPLKDGECPLVK